MTSLRAPFLTLPILALALVVSPALDAQEVIRVYDNETPGAVAGNGAGLNVNGATAANCNATNPNALARTFTVPEAFTVSTVAVGLNITHPTRDEVAAVLRSPSGTTVSFLNDGATNGAGDANNNYDILVASATEGNLRDGDVDDTGFPYYHREVTDPTDDNLPVFAGESSTGTWTLYVCDENNDADTGVLNRARLVLGEAGSLAPVCASTATYDWGDNGQDQAFTSVTVTDITWTESATQDVFGNGADGADFRTRTTTQGADAGYYALGFDADAGDNPNDGNADESGAMIVTFGFDPPVRDLAFSLLDVDLAAGAWEDLVRVTATDAAGTTLPVEAGYVAAASGDRTGDLFEADVTAGTASDQANVDYFVGGPVASLTVEYMTGDTPDAPNGQFSGIGDFVLCGYDYGDAPASYGTSLAADGARHAVADRDLFLGSARADGEADGQPVAAGASSNGANGDGGDEGGAASFAGADLAPGDTYTVTVRVNNLTGAPATLCGWIDFDLAGGPGDGTFETDEGSCVTIPATGNNGACTDLGGGAFDCDVSFAVPADFAFDPAEPTYARFRVASAGLAPSTPTGRVDDGEVEDYQIAAGTLPVTLSWVRVSPDGQVEWQTATETATAGFRLVGRSADGSERTLALVPSRAVDSGAPQGYQVRVDLTGVTELYLVDLDLRGEARSHGPFAPGTTHGAAIEPRRIDWSAVEHPLQPASAARKRSGDAVQEALLAVSEPGIQVVTHDDLVAAGVDFTGVPAEAIALVDDGRALARHIDGGPTFGPGSSIEWVIPEPALTLESPYDWIELVVDPDRAVAAIDRQPIRRRFPAAVTRHTLDTRPDNAYGFSSPTDDPWYDERVVASGPVTVNRRFDLPDLATGGTGAVELTVEMWGGADFPGVDHHARIYLNGELLGDALFDGLAAWTGTWSVEDLVSENDNSLEIMVPNDRGNPFDVLVLEGYEVDYPRHTVALDGRWSGQLGRGRPFTVDGFRDFRGEAVSAWAPIRQSWWRTSVPSPRVTLVSTHWGETWAAAASRRARPGVVAGISRPVAPSEAGYLIVTHPSFVDHLDPLVTLQQARGFEVDVVATDAIYAGLGDHAPSAAAIREHVASSSAAYVLLVGAASYDPYDHLGLGSVSLVPTAYRRTNEFVAFAPSDAALADGDGDGIPDRSIGRLPVRTAEELAAVVAKMWDWQTADHHGTALLTSGLSDDDRRLARQNEAYAAALGAPSTELRAVDDEGRTAVREAVLEAFGPSPRSLVSYVGHTSFGRWDFSPVLTWQDAPTLANRHRPSVVTQWGCWTSYFAAPDIQTISDHLLLVPEVGAVATLGATSLTSTASHERLGRLFFEELAAGADTYGQAFLAAQRRLVAEGGGRDAIDGMVLLGDPATPTRP